MYKDNSNDNDNALNLSHNDEYIVLFKEEQSICSKLGYIFKGARSVTF